MNQASTFLKVNRARSTCHLLLSVHFAIHQRTCLHWRKSRWLCLEIAQEGASHLEILSSAWVILRSQHCSLSVNESTSLRKSKLKSELHGSKVKCKLYFAVFIDLSIVEFTFHHFSFNPCCWQFGIFRCHGFTQSDFSDLVGEIQRPQQLGPPVHRTSWHSSPSPKCHQESSPLRRPT